MSDGSWFAGDHGPEGDWKSLKGRALEPHTLAFDVQDQNMGDARFNGLVQSTGRWDSHTIVSTGMTRGGGAMAK